MNEPMVVYQGNMYTFKEAEELGIIPLVKIESKLDCEEEYDMEIIIDEETRSFRLRVGEREAVDIPKPLLIDAFQISGFAGIRKMIEEDGVDEETLMDLAKAMMLI